MRGQWTSNSLLGEPGHVCLSPSSVTGQGSKQASRPSLRESDPDSSGLAQYAMVLGSGGTVVPDPSLPTPSSGPSDTAIQQGSSQGSDQLKPSRLAPRAEAIKQQGFSSPVASRIEAPQRSSTKTVYEAKWSVFVRWCETSQVDFRSPSVKQIADIILHLFQEKNLQPSTIDGYRSAITDKLGNSSLNVSKDENFWTVFTEIDQRVGDELRLLKEVQPKPSMRQNGPFLSDGVRQVRWTSGLHLSNK